MNIFNDFLRHSKSLLKKISYTAKSFFSVVKESVKNGERRYVVSALAVLSFVGIVCAFAFSGVKMVYKINYFGKDIALVENKETFDSAKKTVVKIVNGKNVESEFASPEYKTVVALSPDINNESELVSAIIENTDGIVFGCVFSVNGEEKFIAEKEVLDGCIQKKFEKYKVEGTQCSYEFVEEIKMTEGYYLKKDMLSENEINYFLSGLTVKTVSEEIVETVIPYSTTEIRDDTMMIGSRKVVIEGVNGKGNTVNRRVFINGVQQGDAQYEENVIVEPINEAINVGTVIPNYYEDIQGTGYCFPLPRGSYDVSAYFGDGRGHKGIDLSANEGTRIMAVAGGTVIRSEWYEGYGNCVEIDHGCGFVTRYAHAETLFVSYGDKVNPGDVIALVGSTGNSTGSHLHIEFIINGSRVDPAFYLGLY